MEEKRIQLLLVEDDKIDQMAFERYVKNKNLPYDYTIAGSIAETRKITKSMSFDIIIADYMLGDGTAFELFDQFKDIPVLVTTGTGNEEVAVEAMRLGAYDYIIKDPESNYLKTLPSTVELALKRKQTEKELQEYHDNLERLIESRTAELNQEIEVRKRAEEKLSLSREFLESVINGIADPVFVKDEEHRWTVVNDALCKMLGYTRAEMLGKSDYDFFPKEQADVFWAHDDMVIASDKVDINEEEITGVKGKRTISTVKSSFTNSTTGKKNLVGT